MTTHSQALQACPMTKRYNELNILKNNGNSYSKLLSNEFVQPQCKN